MAFDDETIRIQVDGAQAQAQLDALAKNVDELDAELKALKDTAGVTNAEIEGTTRRLGEAKAAFKEASEAVEENNKAQEKSGEKTKSLADKYVTLGLRVFGARQVLMAAGEAMRSVAQATDSYSGATKDAIDQTDNLLQSIASLDLIGASKALGQLAGQTVAWAQGLNEVNTELGNLADQNAANEFRSILQAQGELVQGHKDEVAQLNLKSQALSREIDLQQQNGEVSTFLKEKLQEYLDTYSKVHESVPLYLQEQAFELNVVSTATENLGKKAIEAHSKSATAAKAHASSIKEIAAEQDKVIANAQKIIDGIDAAAIKANQAQNSAGDPAVQANAASAEQLKQQIDEIEKSPIITAEQQNNLDTLKNSLLDNARAGNDLNRVFTVTTDEFKTEAEAADKLAAELQIVAETQKFLTDEHNRAIASTEYNDKAAAELIDTYHDLDDLLGDTGSTFNDLGGEVDNLSGYLDDAGDALEGLGDKAKDGTDKAAENLAKMNEGLKESIPLANELKGILAEIVALGAQADI